MASRKSFGAGCLVEIPAIGLLIFAISNIISIKGVNLYALISLALSSILFVLSWKLRKRTSKTEDE